MLTDHNYDVATHRPAFQQLEDEELEEEEVKEEGP